MTGLVRIVQQAYRFALDPTPGQARRLRAHAEGARIAYNWGLSQINAALDARRAEIEEFGRATTVVPDHPGLCRMWTTYKDHAAPCTKCGVVLIQSLDGTWRPEHPDGPCHHQQPHTPAPRCCARCGVVGTQTADGSWRPDRDEPCLGGGDHRPQPGLAWVADNFAGTHQAALRQADQARRNFASSRTGARKGRPVGRPKFKPRTVPAAFQLHGEQLRLVSATKIALPRIGVVTVMSDDSRHPAMRRSRRHATLGERHMGNRRRSRHLWQLLQRSEQAAAGITRLLNAVHAVGDVDRDTAVAALNQIADSRARTMAIQRATERIADAKRALAAAANASPQTRTQLNRQLAQARAALRRSKATTASRNDRWNTTKLGRIERTGQLTSQQAEDLMQAYRLEHDVLLYGQDQIAADTISTVISRRTIATQLRQLASQHVHIVRASISLGSDGLWWVSVTCQIPMQVRTQPTRRQRANGTAGLALGTREIARASARPDRISTPRSLRRAAADLRTAQRWLARCEPGSARRAKARRQVGILHADVARLRTAALHRATTRLSRRYTALNVQGWDPPPASSNRPADPPDRADDRDLNTARADAGIGMLRWQLGYKTARSGTTLTITARDATTERTCSACGRTKPVSPREERFACDGCGLRLPHTVNTARRLAKLATESGSPHGGSAQPRGGDTRPGAARRGRPSSTNRAASSQPPGWGETGTPGP